MRTKLVITCFLTVTIICNQKIFGQTNRIEAPAFAIKYSPVHLIYFFPSVQFSVEHKVLKNINFHYDLGKVVNYRDTESERYSNRRGFRGIAEIRWYLPSPPKVPLYVAGDFYYSRIQFDRSTVMGHHCETRDCDYFEYITYKVNYDSHGFGLKFGSLLFPGWNKNRSVFIDVNTGFTYRDTSFSDVGKPVIPDTLFFEKDGFRLFALNEKNHHVFQPVFGMRVGYRFF